MQNDIQRALNGYFFSKKLQELPSGNGNSFSRTQFLQPITFKIVIAGFLSSDKTMFERNGSISAKLCSSIVGCVFING